LESAPLFTDISPGPPGGAAYWITARDGLRLRLGHLASGARGTVLLFPGRTEVIEKYGAVASDLAAAGYGVLTLDWRGQGLSDRPGAPTGLGHVRHFAQYQKDVAALCALADALDLAQPRFLLAHSMGGCIGLRSLCTEGLKVRAAAFAAPMWGLPLGFRQRAAARVLGVVSRAVGRDGQPVPGKDPGFDLASLSFRENPLTDDRAMFDMMQAQVRAHPDLRLGAPTIGWLAAALREMAALAPLPSPALPAFAAMGSREEVVLPAAIAARMTRWKSGRLEVLDGARHELMMETPEHRSRFLTQALELFAAHR